MAVDTISLLGLSKAGRVLYALSEFYFPFYGLAPWDIFYQLDPYAWISAKIYDIDEEAEGGGALSSLEPGLNALKAFIASRAPIDEQVDKLVHDAREYFSLERAITRENRPYDFRDLRRITNIRSFDFRLLHRTLASRQGQPGREYLFSWFRHFEIVMEIEDDATSVEADTARGTFNIVYLARQLDVSTAAERVDALRREAETALLNIEAFLGGPDQITCKSVRERYRDIVPRPKIGHASKG